MNLKDYYREIAAQEAAITDSYVMVISLPTPDGGREGVVSELKRETAARLLVEKKVRLATPEESARIRAEREEKQRLNDIAALQERVRMARLAEEELRALKRVLQPARKAE